MIDVTQEIKHSGVVDHIEGDLVFVRIVSRSACGSCKARQACGLAEAQVKKVAVHTSRAADFRLGESVSVGVRRSAGSIAVLLAYVGALVVLIAALVVSVGVLSLSEGTGALVSLGAVAGYYLLLALFRKRIEHTITFSINKI